MTGYVTFYSSAEVNELELSQFATDFLKQAGIVRQGGNLGFAAAQLSPLDGLKYNITSGGTFYIENDTYADNGSNPKYWMGRFSGAIETLTFSANSSGSTRIDLIAIEVDTTVTDANADNTGVASLVVVQGTPGAGVPATPANHIALYQVTIVNGETEITDAEVTDVRAEAVLNIPDASITSLSLSKISPVPLTEGQMINGKIVTSVASNNLTVALKTLAGNDPSASDPVYILLAGGVRSITSALSIVMNAGTTNRFNAGSTELRTQTIDYFLYALWDSANSAVRLISSRIPYALTYADFNSTSTNERYGQLSSGSPASSSVVAVIGRYDAILSFSSPNYNWSLPGSPIIIQRPINYTRWLQWEPTYSARPSMTWTSVTTGLARYRIEDRTMTLKIRAFGTTSGTASAGLLITVPLTYDTVIYNLYDFFNSNNVRSAGTWGPGGIQNGDATNQIIFTKADQSNFGLGANTGGLGEFSVII